MNAQCAREITEERQRMNTCVNCPARHLFFDVMLIRCTDMSLTTHEITSSLKEKKMPPFQEWSRRIPPLTGPSLFQLPPPFIAVIGLRPGWRQKTPANLGLCPSARLLVHFFVDCLSSLFQIAFQLTRQRADLIVIRAEARSIREGLGSPQHCTRTTYKW